MGECCSSFTKCLLFSFNLILSVGGLALLVFGIVLHVNPELDLMHIPELNSVLLIALGCIVFVIAGMGCCGAIQESRCLLITFGVLLLLLFAAQTVLGGLALGVSEKDVESFGKEAFLAYPDSIQKGFQCCGWEHNTTTQGLQRDTTNVTQSYTNITDSCCPKVDGGLDPNCDRSKAFKKACKDKWVLYITYNKLGIGVALLLVAFIELIGSIAAMCLANHIGQDSMKVY